VGPTIFYFLISCPALVRNRSIARHTTVLFRHPKVRWYGVIVTRQCGAVGNSSNAPHAEVWSQQPADAPAETGAVCDVKEAHYKKSLPPLKVAAKIVEGATRVSVELLMPCQEPSRRIVGEFDTLCARKARGSVSPWLTAVVHSNGGDMFNQRLRPALGATNCHDKARRRKGLIQPLKVRIVRKAAMLGKHAKQQCWESTPSVLCSRRTTSHICGHMKWQQRADSIALSTDFIVVVPVFATALAHQSACLVHRYSQQFAVALRLSLKYQVCILENGI